MFLEVHAEGEAEHAAIGHSAVLNMVPTEHMDILRTAMKVSGGGVGGSRAANGAQPRIVRVGMGQHAAMRVKWLCALPSHMFCLHFHRYQH